MVHHSDQGSEYVSIKYTERLAEAGIDPSVGTILNRFTPEECANYFENAGYASVKS